MEALNTGIYSYQVPKEKKQLFYVDFLAYTVCDPTLILIQHVRLVNRCLGTF